MENAIVVCLLAVIALLFYERIHPDRERHKKPKQKKNSGRLPDIMGSPRPARSLMAPKHAAEGHDRNPDAQKANFEIEIKENLYTQMQQLELDEIFRKQADLKQEQEEWNSRGISSDDDGFTQGVTLEELSCAGTLLQKDKLAHSEQQTAIALVRKIQGTELFSLLEDSIESASRKITALLDGSLSSENEHSGLNLRREDLDDFNIGDFI